MAAGKYDFSIEQGTSFTLNVVYKNNQGNPVNLTGWCGRLVWKYSSNTDIFYTNVTNSIYQFDIDPLNGKLILQLPASTTNALSFSSATYDVELQSPDDFYAGGGKYTTRILSGTVSVIKRSNPKTPIINNATILANDFAQGYPLEWTVGDLPVTRVSGLNIISGNGISVNNNNGIFTVAVTGEFGLTQEQVDDRVSGLLVGGNYIDLNYNDINNSLSISATGLQPRGDYSLVGHGHNINDVSGLQNILDNKQPSGIYASGTHYHLSSDITDFNSIVDSRIVAANLQPSGNYSLIDHKHVSGDIIDFANNVSGLLPVKTITSGSGINVINSSGNFNVSVTGQFGLTGDQVDNRINNLLKSGSYINLNYNHSNNSLTIEATGLQPFGNYSTIGHQHTINDIDNLQNILDNKQPKGYYATIDSPSLSGTPTVPTAPSGTNNTQIANTQFVRTEISSLVNSVSSTLDTLNELSNALGNDLNFATTVTNSLGQKANLSGATFNGSVIIPSGTGNFNSLTVNGTVVSISGHNHTTSNITDFNNSVSGLLPVKNILSNNYIGITSSSGVYTISATGLQPSGNYSVVGHSHIAANITDFNSSVSGLLPTTTGTNYITSSFQNNIYTIGVTGLQPSGNYSVVGHSHIASNITDFNTSVSGLLPVKNIVAGTGVNVSSSSGTYTISVTGIQQSQSFNQSLNTTDSPIFNGLTLNTLAVSGVNVLNLLSTSIKSSPSQAGGGAAINNIVVISQTDYNNIITKDPTTLYIIS